MINEVKRFWDCSSDRYLESILFQNKRQCLSDRLFVIYEQQAGFNRGLALLIAHE
jgi:hypothetical protein